MAILCYNFLWSTTNKNVLVPTLYQSNLFLHRYDMMNYFECLSSSKILAKRLVAVSFKKKPQNWAKQKCVLSRCVYFLLLQTEQTITVPKWKVPYRLQSHRNKHWQSPTSSPPPFSPRPQPPSYTSSPVPFYNVRYKCLFHILELNPISSKT